MAQPRPQEKTPGVDTKEFYGYLFDAEKSPTPVLNALLRGIAIYIIENVGSKEDKFLTPEKLALFYKAVGGNYDSLFVETTHPSISWIYASIGCQHALNPTKDDFAPPSIPCLTVRGFVRWQSIEILLGPEEHVPFIQSAVRDFDIKNPDTGERFPTELPKEAFPLVPDADIEKWHISCAEKLRRRATPDEEEEAPIPDLPPRPKAQEEYVHVRPSPRVPDPTPSNGAHPRSGYFEPSTREPSTREPSTREPSTREPSTREPSTREPSTREPSTRESATREPATHRPSRPIPYTHVSASRPQRPTLNRSPTHRDREFLAPEETYSPRKPRGRHRSFPNLSSPTSEDAPTFHTHPARPFDPYHRHHNDAVPDPPHPVYPRRHSHPRQARHVPIVSETSDSSSDTSATSDSEDDPSPKTRTSPLKTSTNARPVPRRPQSTYIPRMAGPDSPRVFAFPSTAPGSTMPSPVSDARERERERDRQRDIEDKFRRGQYPANIDLNGKLSAPFLAGRRKTEVGREPDDVGREGDREREREREKVRSDSRGGQGLKWRDLGGIAEMWRNGGTRGDGVSNHTHHVSGGGGGSGGESGERRGSRGHSIRENRGDRERDRERDRDRDRERERERDRERDDRDDRDRGDRERDYKRRERLNSQTRHSSHEEIPTRRMRTERDRERDDEYEGRSFRDRDRDRVRRDRVVSPVRGVDGRKYPDWR
ncbi:hypothetical protein SBOR_1524 [Sclerotinia borealis F-4128]|uniref:DUF7514 domain-containing protein n=1 Tax=Sclerotinia borealis (strain F-4128) TaxID=1432307 RepID=W9CUE3_SCLBF|nr:hypothetical protein SBOR_1524 [Sclerotinia borealis F-4128]